MGKYSDQRDSAFVSTMGPLISAGLRERGYNTRATYDNVMRQLAHESAAGTSDLARRQHNYGGYGHRVVNGKDVYTSFKTNQAFVDAYLNTMAKNYKAALQAKDLKSFAGALKRGGYYEASPEEYYTALNNWGKLSRMASKYYEPFNNVTLDALTEPVAPADNTKVARPVIPATIPQKAQPIQLVMPRQQIITPVQEEESSNNLPDMIDLLESLQNRRLPLKVPTMAGGKDQTVGRLVDMTWRLGWESKYGDPSQHYDAVLNLPVDRNNVNHSRDFVKLVGHPTHPLRGTFTRGQYGDIYNLSEAGMSDPNYVLFGLNSNDRKDGGQYKTHISYHGGHVLPELTVTPDGNYIDNTYDNVRIKLHKFTHGTEPRVDRSLDISGVTQAGVDFAKFGASLFGFDSGFKHGKDSDIHIKPSHRGRFTRYLKAHPGMTAEKAKHSKNPHVRRMATFALNARKWRH